MKKQILIPVILSLLFIACNSTSSSEEKEAKDNVLRNAITVPLDKAHDVSNINDELNAQKEAAASELEEE